MSLGKCNRDIAIMLRTVGFHSIVQQDLLIVSLSSSHVTANFVLDILKLFIHNIYIYIYTMCVIYLGTFLCYHTKFAFPAYINCNFCIVIKFSPIYKCYDSTCPIFDL